VGIVVYPVVVSQIAAHQAAALVGLSQLTEHPDRCLNWKKDAAPRWHGEKVRDRLGISSYASVVLQLPEVRVSQFLGSRSAVF
jgi:hypothetical protein